MRKSGIRVLVAVLLGVAVWLAAGSAAPAVGPSDQGFLYTSKEDISQAQAILQHLGHLKSAPQRGTMDAATREAITDFQHTHNLRTTGALDWETMAQLTRHRPGKDSDGDGVPDALDKCPDTAKGAKVDGKGCPLDADGDGVPDGVDKCPGTAKGVQVDREGCPMDSDRDGVFDGTDKCPDTPKGSKVDANGCPLDADGDGVPDGLDKCPGTPRGIKVNSDGCPLDSDGDGVSDDKDTCPDTPRGSKVDAHGCPEATKQAVFEAGKKSLVLEGVTFDTNSARLKSESSSALDRVAQGLKDNPEIRVEVGGHTDNTGSATRNAQLSKARARSVVDYLVGKGIAPSRFESKGYGSSQPIADNSTAAGRSKNRRVELKQID